MSNSVTKDDVFRCKELISVLSSLRKNHPEMWIGGEFQAAITKIESAMQELYKKLGKEECMTSVTEGSS